MLSHLSAPLVGPAILIVYLICVVIAASETQRYRRLRAGLPYAVVAVVTVLIGDLQKPYDMIGFFILIGACTWGMVWAARKL